MSYVGTHGAQPVAHRDVAQFNDVHDQASGLDWYTRHGVGKIAAERHRYQRRAGAARHESESVLQQCFPTGMVQIMGDS
jgi:hypothetical protein